MGGFDIAQEAMMWSLNIVFGKRPFIRIMIKQLK
jgi:hypothetical protein